MDADYTFVPHQQLCPSASSQGVSFGLAIYPVFPALLIRSFSRNWFTPYSTDFNEWLFVDVDLPVRSFLTR